MLLSIAQTWVHSVETGALASTMILAVLVAWSQTPGEPRYASVLFYGFCAILIVGSISIGVVTNGGELVGR
jgi:hypothetical protein